MKAKVFCLLLTGLFCFSSVCHSQVREYPSKPIQIISAHAAGSSVDAFYRMLGQEVSRMWSTPVNVIAKPASNGVIAYTEVAKSEKDGHTLLAVLANTLASFSVGNPNSPVHIQRDYDPIEIHTFAATTMYVRADSPFKTLKELLDYARQKPGELVCAVSQVGGNGHLEMLSLMRLAKVNIALVHTSGPSEMTTGVLGGHFQLGWGNYALVKPLIDAGKVRPMASDGQGPTPGIPTFEDQGYPISLPFVAGLMGPKGMAPHAMKAWNDALDVVMKDPKFQASLTKAGFGVTMIRGTEKLNNYVKELVKTYSQFSSEELGWAPKKGK
jgi:tripartite-type tricarboxylate transporter receptor subunit TctC